MLARISRSTRIQLPWDSLGTLPPPNTRAKLTLEQICHFDHDLRNVPDGLWWSGRDVRPIVSFVTAIPGDSAFNVTQRHVHVHRAGPPTPHHSL